MQRIYKSNDFCVQDTHELMKQTAFHEAGHAASVYLGNKKKHLPPVFFQIQMSQPSTKNCLQYAKVVDGRLIENLPIVEFTKINHLTKEEKKGLKSAYQADVINLLVGPLAEAKYVAIRDDEVFSFQLLNPQALSYYGGESDVEKAYSYLTYFIESEAQRETEMSELFLQAFQFVSNHENWIRILSLAHHLLISEKEIISCEEAIEILKEPSIQSVKQ